MILNSTSTAGTPVSPWRKSSFSGSHQGQCVEERRRGDALDVRDSKNPAGPVLSFPDEARQAFHAGVRAGALGEVNHA